MKVWAGTGADNYPNVFGVYQQPAATLVEKLPVKA